MSDDHAPMPAAVRRYAGDWTEREPTAKQMRYLQNLLTAAGYGYDGAQPPARGEVDLALMMLGRGKVSELISALKSGRLDEVAGWGIDDIDAWLTAESKATAAAPATAAQHA